MPLYFSAIVLADAEVVFDDLFEKIQGGFGVGHDVRIVPYVHRAAIVRLRKINTSKEPQV